MDLSRPRQITDDRLDSAEAGSAQSGGAEAAWADRVDSAEAGPAPHGGASWAAGTARHPRYARVSRHRRRWPRSVWRRFEVAAWATSLGVIVIVVASVATAVASREQRHYETTVTTETKVTTQLPNCAFFPCEHPALSGKPTRVRIPSIQVESPLEELARDRAGVLQPPTSNTRAGWFAEGTPPGDVGPAVIAGHVDSTDGKAVFYDLYRLRAGDEVQVLRGGQWVTFRVVGTKQYPKTNFPTEQVYGNTPDAELRLITCGGEFDKTLLSYRDNIVVFAHVDWSRTPASALS